MGDFHFQMPPPMQTPPILSQLFARIACCLLPLGLPTAAFAGDISVQEIRTTIYEKEISGFRLLLPYSPADIWSGVRAHFASVGKVPMALEKVLLYENIHCPDISAENELTLFFVCDAVGDNLTQFTIAGSYDYRHPITIAESPDLAMRLLLDAATLVQAFGGDNRLVFSHLFDNTLPKDIRERYEDRRQRLEQQLYMSVSPLVTSSDAPAVMIHTSPFSPDAARQSMPSRNDEEVATVLANRFDTYIAANPAATSVAAPEAAGTARQQGYQRHEAAAPASAKTAAYTTQRLRDSFEHIVQALQTANGHLLAQNQELSDKAAGYDPESLQAQERLRAYRTRQIEMAKREDNLDRFELVVEGKLKLSEQRLRYLGEYENSHDVTVLLNRIRELEESVQRLEAAQAQALGN